MLHQRAYDEIGRRILVADDDDELRGVVVDALRADGYVVAEARDGEEMLSQLSRTSTTSGPLPDLILADVRMPKLSGLGVLAELRHAGLRLPFVIMTGFFPESVEVVARRLGAVGVLKKPFDLDDLRTALMNAHAPA